MTTLESVKELQARLEQSIIGQKQVVKRLIIGLLADGNLLLEQEEVSDFRKTGLGA